MPTAKQSTQHLRFAGDVCGDAYRPIFCSLSLLARCQLLMDLRLNSHATIGSTPIVCSVFTLRREKNWPLRNCFKKCFHSPYEERSYWPAARIMDLLATFCCCVLSPEWCRFTVFVLGSKPSKGLCVCAQGLTSMADPCSVCGHLIRTLLLSCE